MAWAGAADLRKLFGTPNSSHCLLPCRLCTKFGSGLQMFAG